MQRVLQLLMEVLRSMDFRKLALEILDAWHRFQAGEEVDIVVVTLDKVRVTIDIRKR